MWSPKHRHGETDHILYDNNNSKGNDGNFRSLSRHKVQTDSILKNHIQNAITYFASYSSPNIQKAMLESDIMTRKVSRQTYGDNTPADLP